MLHVKLGIQGILENRLPNAKSFKTRLSTMARFFTCNNRLLPTFQNPAHVPQPHARNNPTETPTIHARRVWDSVVIKIRDATGAAIMKNSRVTHTPCVYGERLWGWKPGNDESLCLMETITALTD